MSAYSYRSSRACPSITGVRKSGLTWAQINGSLRGSDTKHVARWVWAVVVGVGTASIIGVML